MKLKTKMGAALVVATLVSGAFTSMAGAAPEPSGWDDVNDQVVSSGSDTTYNVMQRFETLYNQGLGCDTVNTSFATVPNNGGTCLLGAAQTSTEFRANWDHDFFVGKYPTGSSAGIAALKNGSVDYARSSRAGGASDTALNFWAFGKDALAIVTFGSRATGNLTIAQLQGIYNCSITNWNQIDPSYPSATIEPVGMNSSSGTYATFNTLVGVTANNGTCVKRVGADPAAVPPVLGTFPFENDVKPIIDDPQINEENAIWWMSWAEFRSFSYKRGSAKAWSINSQPLSASTVNNNNYPLTRLIYHVTQDSITAAPASSDVTGPDGGKQGAVREFTEFMCKPDTALAHGPNQFTGRSNYLELGAAYTATGFLRVPVAQRTNGICVLEQA